MNKIGYLGPVLGLLMLQGCVVGLTGKGEGVRLVDNMKDYNCKFVSVVTGSGSYGISKAHDAEGAMNDVRNKAAKAGANAMRVTSTDSDDDGTVVIAEALSCEFTH